LLVRLLSWLLVLQDHLLSSVGLAPTELNGLAMKSSGLGKIALQDCCYYIVTDLLRYN